MHRSRLESYQAILEALVTRPLDLDTLSYETGTDCMILNKHLDFLANIGIVEQRMAGSKMLYAATERGVKVFRALNFQQYVRRISSTLTQIDEAMETIREISKNEKER